MVRAVQSTDSGSNTGLLNLTSGNLAEDFRYGACNVLTPVVDTKPGGSIGDIYEWLEPEASARGWCRRNPPTHQGIAITRQTYDRAPPRLEAAIDAGCYDYADVTNPANYELCIPDLLDFNDDAIRATAVFRVPILATDIINSGLEPEA